MKYNIDRWLDYKDMMRQIASEYRKKYPMVEADDLQQEMYLWFVTHPNKFKEWDALEERDKNKLIAKSLRNQCLKYCEKEKAKNKGYDLTDLYYYDVSVVEAFLPSIIVESYEMPSQIKDLNLKFNNGQINDGMNWLALRSDIAKGYYRLPESKQNILRLRYMNEQTEWSELAEYMSTSSADGARKKVERALASIVQNLGGWRAYFDQDIQDENQETKQEEV